MRRSLTVVLSCLALNSQVPLWLPYLTVCLWSAIGC